MGDTIAAEAIGDEVPRLVIHPLQQSLEEALGGCPISPLLHQDVQHDAKLVHNAPQIVQHATDTDEYLIHVPGVSSFWPAPVLASREVGAELQTPVSYTFVGHDDAALGEDQRDVAQAETGNVVQPHSIVDDLGREAGAVER